MNLEGTRWLRFAVALAAVSVHAACGAADEQGGAEGDGAEGAAATTSSSSVGTSTGGGSSGGADGGGAGIAGTGGGGGDAPYEMCLQDCKATSPNGSATYDAFAQCVYCGECASDCDGGGYLQCTGMPTGRACDDTGDCEVCSDCAKQMGCAENFAQCAEQMECVDYANCIAQCGLL